MPKGKQIDLSYEGFRAFGLTITYQDWLRELLQAEIREANYLKRKLKKAEQELDVIRPKMPRSRRILSRG